ncbi:MAG TPA: Asp-tRNA(Asn)/Glu-tRNA(Gln) amidotransferase subunit GatC [Firmicutes bacterium]|jgi:aspartyl-tRNA(Asn)/glutamyl-tRNA(Gln) amidotransferase subunit C|nr:Asp-tRNA(Asn)/Glu-tRNA(Gln) amidotransferase subunit GatC [Bacillota bacterium]
MAADEAIGEREMDELAELACLYLEPAEKKMLNRRLNALMELLGKIGEVETGGVEPDIHPGILPPRFREDEVEPSLSPGRVFQNSAHRSDSFFRVPSIAGEGPGGA